MKTVVFVLVIFVLLSVGQAAPAAGSVFFEEQFTGPNSDPAVWRTEILTSGPRWCDSYPGSWWGPGSWVEEGVECHGVAVHSPYGSALLSDGLMHMSSSNDRAFPALISRLPGTVSLFPPSGDFTLAIRLRFDRVTPWGVGIVVYQAQSTEPAGDNLALSENVLLQLWCGNPGGGLLVATALGGSIQLIAEVPPATEFHEITLECLGTSFTILADGQAIYGPVTSALRPAAVAIGNPVLAFWYPTDWTSFSVDYIRVEVPGPVPVETTSWGAIKATYRDATR
jgi:hypothetical protein